MLGDVVLQSQWCSLSEFIFLGSRVRRKRGVSMSTGFGEKMKLSWNMVFVQVGLVLLCLVGPCVAQVSKNKTVPTPQPAQKKQAVATKATCAKETKSTTKTSVSYAAAS